MYFYLVYPKIHFGKSAKRITYVTDVITTVVIGKNLGRALSSA